MIFTAPFKKYPPISSHTDGGGGREPRFAKKTVFIFFLSTLTPKCNPWSFCYGTSWRPPEGLVTDKIFIWLNGVGLPHLALRLRGKHAECAKARNELAGTWHEPKQAHSMRSIVYHAWASPSNPHLYPTPPYRLTSKCW